LSVVVDVSRKGAETQRKSSAWRISRLGVKKKEKPFRSRYGLFTRGVAVLMAYLFLICPPIIQNLAEAATQYSRLTTDQWANAGTTITYQYDDNGALILKTETGKPQIGYSYNLQGRLECKYDTNNTPTEFDDDTILVQYVYNDAGIRVRKIENPGQANEITTIYLVDSYNPTGYAQVLEETTNDDTDITRTTYVLGDDVLYQGKANWVDPVWQSFDNEYLLYDGHGSTRQVSYYDDTPGDEKAVISADYSYDAYGIMLGGNPAAGSSPTKDSFAIFPARA
jgi:YD repeat-containing protein